MESDRLLKETKAVIIINLMDYIQELIKKYEHTFKEPESGIYLVDSATPLLKPTQAYFSESSFKSQTPLTSLDDVEEQVVDENGDIIIPTYIMRRKSKMLSSKPTLPVRALQIAFETIQDQIDELLIHTPAREYGSGVKLHIKPEYHYLVTDGYIEASLGKLVRDISLFVGSDIWNLYYFKLNKTDLLIEKGIDFRVYDWTLKKEQEVFSDTDE